MFPFSRSCLAWKIFFFLFYCFFSDALGTSDILPVYISPSWDAFTFKSYFIGLYVLCRLFSDLFLFAHW